MSQSAGVIEFRLDPKSDRATRFRSSRGESVHPTGARKRPLSRRAIGHRQVRIGRSPSTRWPRWRVLNRAREGDGVTDIDLSSRSVIAVGIDGSGPSKRALRWAAKQAELTGATLRVVTTWMIPTALGWMPQFPEGFNPEEDAANVQRQEVAEVLGPSPNVHVEYTVVGGNPAATLIDMSHDVDLIVVGNRGHGGFAGLLIGSVSENVVTHAECPVVVIRP